MEYKEFVDLCILCGCDYTDTIDGIKNFVFKINLGIGPVTAYKLVKEHKNIEKILEHLKKENENPNRKKKY